MLKLYIECSPKRVSVFWVVGQWPEVRIFTRLYLAKEEDQGSIVTSIRWIVNNTPAASADTMFVDCKEYNLIDQEFWRSWGVNCEVERWILPDKKAPEAGPEAGFDASPPD